MISAKLANAEYMAAVREGGFIQDHASLIFAFDFPDRFLILTRDDEQTAHHHTPQFLVSSFYKQAKDYGGQPNFEGSIEMCSAYIQDCYNLERKRQLLIELADQPDIVQSIKNILTANQMTAILPALVNVLTIDQIDLITQEHQMKI